MAGHAVERLEIGDHAVDLADPGKVMYPETGFTKRDVADYYHAVAPAILPHIESHPLTLERYPDGVAGPHLHEKRCPPGRPVWLQTVDVPSRRAGTIRYCTVDDAAGLVWLANLAALEVRPLLARAPRLDRPRSMVFDLDPGPPAGLIEAGRVGLMARDLLARNGVPAQVKTSGSDELHVAVALDDSSMDFEQTKLFALSVARELERLHPGEVVSSTEKGRRRGKVLVDWTGNDEHKTTVAPYSLRATDRPVVSTPVSWDELSAAVDEGDRDALAFGPDDVLARIARLGDLWSVG